MCCAHQNESAAWKGRVGRAVLRLVVLVSVATWGATTALATEPDARTLILTASHAFSTAYVQGDTATIRSLYTEDAVLLPPGRELVGNGKIARYFAPRAGRVNISHAMESSRLDISGDRAVDVGTWHNTWRRGDAAKQSASGGYLVVWERGADGRWRIAYDMWHRPAE